MGVSCRSRDKAASGRTVERIGVRIGTIRALVAAQGIVGATGSDGPASQCGQRRGLGVGGGLGHLGDGPFLRRFGWLLQQKGIPQVAGMVAAGGLPQAIIAHLVEAGWQDVLEKAPDELVAGHGLVAMAIGRPVLVTEGGGLGVDGQDAVVGDGDAESVACSASTSMSGTLSQVGRFWLLRRLALGFEVLLEGVAESVGGGCRCGVSFEGGAIGGGATAVAVGVHLEDGRMMD